MSAPDKPPADPLPPPRKFSVPLYVRVLIAVVLGIAVGLFFKSEPIAFGWTTEHLGELAKLVIRLLTALATPLIFFAILDAFVKTQIGGRQGLKLVFICVINIAVAFAIGLTIMNVLQPALGLREWFSQILPEKPPETVGVSLSPLEQLKKSVPNSLLQPFVFENPLGLVMLAVLIGIAIRTLRARNDETLHEDVLVLERLIAALFHLLMQLLQFMVQIVPFAVFGILADVVGENGLEKVLQLLGTYLAAILGGLAIHSLLYYPLVSWLVGGKSPLRFMREAFEPMVTGLSVNSSLATVPLTLDALKRLEVSDTSARLSACVGTNFNNDGITLYEAMTALFIAQVAGYDLTVGQQVTVMIASLSASMGSAGVPNSGLVILPLVLSAAGLPPVVIQQGLPLVQSVDWIAARVRSAVNVAGDLTVAVLLDVGERRDEPIPPAHHHKIVPPSHGK